jgi:hypothetical protein
MIKTREGSVIDFVDVVAAQVQFDERVKRQEGFALERIDHILGQREIE